MISKNYKKKPRKKKKVYKKYLYEYINFNK